MPNTSNLKPDGSTGGRRHMRAGYWAYSSDNTAAMEEGGRIVHHKNGMPDYKPHLGEMPVVPLQDDWEDIRPAARPEPFGYPTQKPVALPERIIASSRNEGDVVLDPFCGSGTTIHAAQDLKRHRVGTDICVDARKVMEEWLRVHSDSLWPDLKFFGMPRTRDDAQFMASRDALPIRAAGGITCGWQGGQHEADGGQGH